MPVTRPEDKGKDKSQWWKGASTEQIEKDDPNQLKHGIYDQQEKPENMRKEEMSEIQHPESS
jgi:hypothetical protein